MNKKVMPTAWFFVCAIFEVFLRFALPFVVINSPLLYIGILLIIFGAWITIWADNLFKKKKTTVKPYEESDVLIVSGPFTYTRNPMYLGMLAFLLGISMLTGAISTIIPVIVFFIIIHLFYILPEEKMLKEKFGKDYLDFKAKVRRWL